MPKVESLGRIPIVATLREGLQDFVEVEVLVGKAANQIVHVRCAGAFALDVVGVTMQAIVQDDVAEFAHIVALCVKNGSSQPQSQDFSKLSFIHSQYHLSFRSLRSLPVVAR